MPANDPSADGAAAERAILDLVTERGAGRTVCPTEAARRLDAQNWRARLKDIRAAAARLADRGLIRVTRKGKAVDIRTVKGVIRLGLPAQ